MKFLKRTLMLMLLAIITDITITHALAYAHVMVVEHLNKNDASYTNYYEKNTAQVQTYENMDTFTGLTNPCPKCYVMVKPFEQNGDNGGGRLTVMGRAYVFTDTTS